MIEDTRRTWYGDEWGAAFLWSDAFIWSDAFLLSQGYVWSDAFLWSQAVAGDDPLYVNANSLALADDGPPPAAIVESRSEERPRAWRTSW